MIGTLLGNRYELIELIGTGGMANVYKAKCTLLNRNVAVKVLKDEFKDDEEFLKRFNIESQAAAGLSHNNIVSIYDVGTQDDIHYIVMEYVEGETLKQYLKEKGALPIDVALDFSIQIASALQHAHRKGIIHRDIKPQNILVTKDGVLKVTDFGIARAVSGFTMKVDDNAIGTAHYCSPEQARGGYTDEKSDIYSMGVVMYEMFTGKLPFESDSSVSVALKQIQEEPVRPTEINPSIPQEIESIILKAMKKEQSERFANAGELIIELNWVKQALSQHWGKKEPAPVPVIDNASETKVINIDKKDLKHTIKSQNAKKPKKKEDKVAVIAGIISSIVVVCILGVIGVTVFFPGLISFGHINANGELEVPDFVGIKYEKAVSKYKTVKFEKIEEYSADYDEGVIVRQDPEEGTLIKEPFEITVYVSKGGKSVKVPDVEGMDYKKAGKKLDEEDINWTVKYELSDEIPENVVIKVTPTAGTKINTGKDTVTMIVSSGADSKSISVPNVLGLDVKEAKSELTQKGLVASVVYDNSSKAYGTVLKQSVSPDSKVSEKTEIVLTASNGKAEEIKDETQPSDNNSNNSTNNSSGNNTQTTTSSKEITVMLPSGKDSVVVKVTLNGTTVYERTHQTSEGAVSVPVKGSGKGTVATYVDGSKVGEREITF